jgi:thymidine phosphorylase
MGLLAMVDIGIDTHQDPMVYMRSDCDVCLAEGFSTSKRVGLAFKNRKLIATFNVVDERALLPGHIGLS